MRKEEIIVALAQHLHANASTLSKQPAFQDYFNRVRSPIKRESEAVASSSFENVARSVKARGRRISKMMSSEPEWVFFMKRKQPQC